jgi:hypothetical protein
MNWKQTSITLDEWSSRFLYTHILMFHKIINTQKHTNKYKDIHMCIEKSEEMMYLYMCVCPTFYEE